MLVNNAVADPCSRCHTEKSIFSVLFTVDGLTSASKVWVRVREALIIFSESGIDGMGQDFFALGNKSV